jgi:hypothetical protein
MKRITVLCAALAGGYALSASACDIPTMIDIPDGATSTKEQLLTAQADVKTYLAAMEEYLACLNNEIDSAGDDAAEEFNQLMVARYNNGVTEMETVANEFNDQVKAYKEANSGN